MFHPIPAPIRTQMERLDARDRANGTPRMQRLRQVPPQTGRFLALMAAATPEGLRLEIGTSAGHSALWLALACRETGHELKTFELLPEKVSLARQTFRAAEVEDVVTLLEGDANARPRKLGRAFESKRNVLRRP